MPNDSIFKLMGLAGIVLFFAGAHQIWLARDGVLFWLERFVRIFTVTLKTREIESAAAGPEPLPHKPEMRTLHLVGGLGLMVLGSFMVLASLGLILWVRS